MIGKTVSHYKILEKLGEGGMGVVYKAEDTKLKRTVALKFLSLQSLGTPDEKTRFVHEAQAAAALDHPNICTVHEIDEADGHTFIAMAYVDGQSLSEKTESGPLKLKEALGLATDIARGLQEAHEKGIVHRDIKNANIMVTKKGQAKITDFGLAKLAGQTRVTKTGTSVGTVAYMSPEQARGEDVDHRSDIWSLGVILYEMITGQLPFRGDHAQALTYQIVHENAEPITAVRTGVPMELERIVSKCMEKEAYSRYQHVDEVVVDLGKALRAVSGQPEAHVPPVDSRRWKPFAAIATGLVLLVVVALIMNPFKLEVTRPDATAGENKLAVMYFDNMADPDDSRRHGEMLAELLMTGLSESEQLSIVSSQRLYDLLKLLGKEGEKKIDRTTATEVATRARARWMMVGRILQAEPNFVVTAQIVDVATGDVTASQRTSGNTGESLFSLVDRITTRTLDDLAVAETRMNPRPVAEMSTASEDAYRYYLEGIENNRKQFTQEARGSFAKSLEIDSTFAMAAFHLGFLESGDLRNRLFQQAVRHADRASTREKLYLLSAEAVAERNWEEAAPAFEAVIEKYPDDKFALEQLASYPGVPEKQIKYGRRLLELDPAHTGGWNSLAYAYSALGDPESALTAIDHYIELAPGEPNPYDTRGDICARFGRLDEAIASYQKSIDIKPDFGDYGSVFKLGHMYTNRGDYELAEAQYRRLFESPDARVRWRGRRCLIELLRHRGRCAEALRQLEVARGVDRMEGVTDPEHDQKVRILMDLGETAQALEALDEVLESGDDFWRPINASYYLARMGRGDEADQYLAPLRAREDSLRSFHKFVYEMHKARVAGARGNYDDAITRYNTLWNKATRERDTYWLFRFCYDFAEVCFEARRWNDVIRVVEEALTGYSNRTYYGIGIRNARFHYFLGVAYQEVGRGDDAIEQLEKLLTIWADADPQLIGLEDARTRLATLKRGG